MTDEAFPIPTLAEMAAEARPEPFPVDIEPYDSEWWLNPDQKAICDAFLGECQFDKTCAVMAVREYKNKAVASAAATRYFKMAKIRRYLWLRSKQLTEKFEISQEEILRDLVEVKEMAMGRKDTPVYTVDKDGEIIEERAVTVANLPVAKSALELLGKYHEIAMWNERKDDNNNGKGGFVLNLQMNLHPPQGDTTGTKLTDGLTIDMKGEDDN